MCPQKSGAKGREAASSDNAPTQAKKSLPPLLSRQGRPPKPFMLALPPCPPRPYKIPPKTWVPLSPPPRGRIHSFLALGPGEDGREHAAASCAAHLGQESSSSCARTPLTRPTDRADTVSMGGWQMLDEEPGVELGAVAEPPSCESLSVSV